MPTRSLAFLRPLAQFARDAATSSAFAAIPVGRLHGRQVMALVAASASLAAAGTFLGLRAAARARTAAPDGWMPWTPHGQAAPTDSAKTEGDGAKPLGVADRRALVRRAAIAAASGTMSGTATAVGVVVDRRLESFFTDRGVRHARLAVGLSQGIGYAGLIALIAAVVDAREDPGSHGNSGEDG
ncbi:hypothetical protein [Brachybacterium sp. 107]|uniref:hypothetical protein n=1 Tax=Brachybacterium sp. 107 TaxID=3457736 RepID=UPI004034B7C7